MTVCTYMRFGASCMTFVFPILTEATRAGGGRERRVEEVGARGEGEDPFALLQAKTLLVSESRAREGKLTGCRSGVSLLATG